MIYAMDGWKRECETSTIKRCYTLKNEALGGEMETSSFMQYLFANDPRTLVRYQTSLYSNLPALLSGRVEKFSIRKYQENGDRQQKGMLSVLEMLREKYVHCFLLYSQTY